MSVAKGDCRRVTDLVTGADKVTDEVGRMRAEVRPAAGDPQWLRKGFRRQMS